jgi:hypothetical protein
MIDEHCRIVPAPMQAFPEPVVFFGTRLGIPVSRMNIYSIYEYQLLVALSSDCGSSPIAC